MAIVWPGAEKLGPEEGKPPAIAVYRDGKIAGYIFSTLDIVHAPGFSGIPFDVIAGVDLTGHISGAKVIFHREPHVYQDEIRQPQLDTFLARTAGTGVARRKFRRPASRLCRRSHGERAARCETRFSILPNASSSAAA